MLRTAGAGVACRVAPNPWLRRASQHPDMRGSGRTGQHCEPRSCCGLLRDRKSAAG